MVPDDLDLVLYVPAGNEKLVFTVGSHAGK